MDDKAAGGQTESAPGADGIGLAYAALRVDSGPIRVRSKRLRVRGLVHIKEPDTSNRDACFSKKFRMTFCIFASLLFACLFTLVFFMLPRGQSDLRFRSSAHTRAILACRRMRTLGNQF